jgi:hemerythrin-like metal-binding protein
MALAAWDETYSVGNALLDADHRIILDLLNQLHDAADTDQSRIVVGSILNVLVEYTEHHFRREEVLMALAGYPRTDEHVASHRRLEARVGTIRSLWAAGDRQALNEEVLSLLKKWLTGHILEDDKAYGPWVEAASAGAETARNPACDQAP